MYFPSSGADGGTNKAFQLSNKTIFTTSREEEEAESARTHAQEPTTHFYVCINLWLRNQCDSACCLTVFNIMNDMRSVPLLPLRTK